MQEGSHGGVAGGRASGFGERARAFVASKVAPMALIYSAYRAGSWIKGKMDEGESTLIEKMMGRMASERLSGRDPRSPMWQRTSRDVDRYGHSLGYTSGETHHFYQMGLQATGVLPRNMARQNMALMRGYNLEPGALFGYQGAFRQAGGFVGGGDPNLALIRGMKLGGFARALSGEMAHALSGLLSSASVSNDQVKASTIPGLMAILSKTLGGVYRDSPQRSASLLQGLHQTIRTPGGGEAGQAFMLRAMGFGKKGVTYEDALERMGEGGLTNTKNLRNFLQQIQKEYKGQEVLAMHRLSGGAISIKEAKSLKKLMARPEMLTEQAITEAMKTQQVDLAGEAAKSKQGTALVRRKIGLAEQKATMRAAGDPAYEKVNQIYLNALKDLTQVIKALIALFSWDRKAFESATSKATEGFAGTLALTAIGMGPIAIRQYILNRYTKKARGR